MDTLLRDLRVALRSLSRAPAFTAVAAVSLAAAIAANATVFALVDGLVLRPLPKVPEATRLVRAFSYAENAASAAEYEGVSYAAWEEMRRATATTSALSGLAGASTNSFGVADAEGDRSSGAAAARAWGFVVTGNYFDVLGVRPALGRGFTAEEDRDAAAPPVVVISDRYWRQRFAADPSAVGRSILINGHPFTIVGVAPPGFVGHETIFDAELWVPVRSYVQARGPAAAGMVGDRGERWMMPLGRLGRDATIERASSELATVARRLAAAYPTTDGGRTVRVFREADARPEPGLPTRLFAAVLLSVGAVVLLVACANVANLVLARATGRRREVAVRSALGAGRGRLVRQLLTESVVLALAGGALGVLLSLWAGGLLRLLAPPTDIPFIVAPPMTGRVLLFALAASALTVAAFGLAPALTATRGDLALTIKGESVIGGRRRGGVRSALVVAQLALSTVLLVTAGLLVRSLRGATRVDPGFDLRAGITVPLDLRFVQTDSVRGPQYFRRVVERVSALPGVESAALVSPMPLGWSSSSEEIYPEGFTPGADGRGARVQGTLAGLGYFSTIGIRLLEGRDFTRADAEPAAGAEPVIVNRTLAARYWPGQLAVGKRLRFGAQNGREALVVGVVADGKYRQLGEDPRAMIYRPFPRVWASSVDLVVRARTMARSDWSGLLMDAVRRELAAIDPAVPLSGMVTIDQHMGRALLPARAGAAIVSAVATLALVLAAVGLYGVLAYVVAQRTREIGVRVALGARPADVMRLTVGQGVRLTMIGLGAGTVLALAASRALAGVLYGVSASDPLTFVLIAALLSAVALLACGVPAWRASRVDPVTALRSE